MLMVGSETAEVQDTLTDASKRLRYAGYSVETQLVKGPPDGSSWRMWSFGRSTFCWQPTAIPVSQPGSAAPRDRAHLCQRALPGDDLLHRPARILANLGIGIVEDGFEEYAAGGVGDFAKRGCGFLAQVCLRV